MREVDKLDPQFSVSKGLDIKGSSWIFALACEDCKTGLFLEDMSLLARQVSSQSRYEPCQVTDRGRNHP